jgi:16S rRNA (cytidine1402-2'-O)-methyltransferase
VIADPGHLLVQGARSHGIRVLCVPGASALTAAMSVAGISADAFFFSGSLPDSPSALRRAISQLLSLPDATVSFVPGTAASNVLRVLAELAPRRGIVLACNLTSLDEWIARGTPGQVQRRLREAPPLERVTLVMRGRSRCRDKGRSR